MKRGSSRALAVGISLAILAVLLLGGELGFRAFGPEDAGGRRENFRRYLLTGAMAEYEPRAYTNFQRPRVSEFSNSFGFQDVAWNLARTPGVPRVVCIGGSTTEGGNLLGVWGSYPHFLEQVLEQRTGRDFEVLDAGIAGWTSAEMLVSWFLTLQDLDPDVVVLHEAVNDLEPRFLTGFRPDYSHWRVPIRSRPASGPWRWLARWSELYVHLRLLAEPTPDIKDVSTDCSAPREPLLAEGKMPHETSLPFRRNIAAIARAARAEGRQVVLMTMPTSPTVAIDAFWRYGIAENNQHLRELAAELGVRLADAERAFAARPELAEQFLDLVHIQPPGNQAKAELVADALADWVGSLSREGERPPRPRN